jgi:hypothetical protein
VLWSPQILRGSAGLTFSCFAAQPSNCDSLLRFTWQKGHESHNELTSIVMRSPYSPSPPVRLASLTCSFCCYSRLRYLQSAWEDPSTNGNKERPARQFNEKTVPFIHVQGPTQDNGSDCGVFVVHTMGRLVCFAFTDCDAVRVHSHSEFSVRLSRVVLPKGYGAQVLSELTPLADVELPIVRGPSCPHFMHSCVLCVTHYPL